MQRSARTAGTVLVTGLLLSLVACGLAPSSRPDADQPPRVRETLITPAPPEVTEAPQPRPNVLVIETDDMRSDDLRWMPNVRRLLQRRGLTFENSFAPYPLCCPSRASFLTGRYAHNHDVYSHVDPYGFGAFKDRRTLATVLQRAGYTTALVGKYLNGYGNQPVHRTGESSLDYVPPGWSQWYAGSDRAWLPWETYGGGTYDYFSLTQNINGRLESFPGRYSTGVLAEQTRQLVRDFGRGSKPWFVWWTPVAPHHGSPNEADDPGSTVRTDGYTTHWNTPARPEWVKGQFDEQITHGSGTPHEESAEEDVSDKPRYLRRMPELTDAERAALTTVTRQRAESLFVLDVHIGRTISTLSRTGQLPNTVILLTSDNGYYLGEHRKRQGKINLHEPSLRVPLIIAGPGVPRGHRYDPVTTVDLAPTIAAYAGTRMRRPDGIDLRPVITGGDRGWDRPVVTEGMMPEVGYAAGTRLGPSVLNTRGLRLGRWKLTRYSTGESELYDLHTDPLELNNLARRPAHATTLRQMKRLWRRYADCRGAECVATVPAKYRVTARASRVITERQKEITRRYYGG
ncbi:MAG TPA: sulfatase [Marmoricola sp.]|nr:sulfatase [Marmoricola sp.]